MTLVLTLIMTAGFIWSTYKIIDGINHIRKYSANRFAFHAFICSATSIYLLLSIVLWFIERLL